MSGSRAIRVAVVSGVAAGALLGTSGCHHSVWHTSHGLRYCTGTLLQCAQQASPNVIERGQQTVTLAVGR